MVIGCHGMRHRRWAGLDEPSLREELVDARAIIEEISGQPVVEAACPFGSYDRRVAHDAARRGLSPRLHERPRNGAARGLPPGAQHASRPGDGKDLLERIGATDAAPFRAWARRAKLAVKRWR